MIEIVLGLLAGIASGSVTIDDSCPASWLSASELGALLTSASVADVRAVDVEILVCNPEPSAFAITIDVDGRSRPRIAKIDLSDTSTVARLRALALSIEEAARTPEKTSSAVVTAGSDAPRGSDLELSVGPVMRLWPSYGPPSLGLQVVAGLEVARHAVVQIELATEIGRTTVDPGRIDFGIASMSVAGLLVGRIAAVRLGFGARLEGGLAWAQASPARSDVRGDDLRGSLLAPAARLHLAIDIAEGWAVGVAIDAGTALAGIEARVANESVVGLAGPFARVGVSVVRRL